MLSLRRRSAAGHLPAEGPRQRNAIRRAREFATDGTTIYSARLLGLPRRRRAGHALSGTCCLIRRSRTPTFCRSRPTISVFDDQASGRPGRPMLAVGRSGRTVCRMTRYAPLSPTFARLGGGVQATPDTNPPRWARETQQTGERLFTANCAGCHGHGGDGGEGPALNNTAFLHGRDRYVSGRARSRNGRRGTVMQGFRKRSPTRPALTPAEIESDRCLSADIVKMKWSAQIMKNELSRREFLARVSAAGFGALALVGDQSLGTRRDNQSARGLSRTATGRRSIAISGNTIRNTRSPALRTTRTTAC